MQTLSVLQVMESEGDQGDLLPKHRFPALHGGDFVPFRLRLELPCREEGPCSLQGFILLGTE